MRKRTLFLVAIAAMIYATARPVAGCGESYGKQEWNTRVEDGWKPIDKITDKPYQDVGGWAVSEFLKHVNCTLKFDKVVSGEENVLSALRYELVIDVSDISGELGKYKAEVYEDGWTNTRKLISFRTAN